MLNIVIPMAGAGSRFARVGYKDPKPLIPVHGVPMIEVVVRNLRPSRPHRFVFICQRAHLEAYDLDALLQRIAPGSVRVALDGLTEGAACTVLEASAHIANDDPLMIANSDQYIAADIDDYLADMDARHLDGLIMTMRGNDPKWSFAKTDAQGLVTAVAEKQPISDDATVGVYNFRQGRLFTEAAREMIRRDERTNGEFYVAPVYNGLVAAGGRVGIHSIGSDGQGMHGIGTPKDLDLFLALPWSRRACGVAA